MLTRNVAGRVGLTVVGHQEILYRRQRGQRGRSGAGRPSGGLAMHPWVFASALCFSACVGGGAAWAGIPAHSRSQVAWVGGAHGLHTLPTSRFPQCAGAFRNGAHRLKPAPPARAARSCVEMYNRPPIGSFYHRGVEFLHLEPGDSTQGAAHEYGAQSVYSGKSLERATTDTLWTGPGPKTPGGMQWYSRCPQGTGVSEASRKISEIPLFSIGRVLLPGSSFPLQIFPHKEGTQKMFQDLRENKNQNGEECRFGIVLAREGVPGAAAAVGCEADVTELTKLDDGRLVVQCVGQRRFRILDVVQQDPYPVAVVLWIEDEDDGDSAQGGELETECWRLLQEIVWLCVEVWDKRAWVPLLMGEGDKHPLHDVRWSAPGGGGQPSFNSEIERRAVFSWHMTRMLRNGIPGLWDHDLTESNLPSMGVQKLLETTSVEARLIQSLSVLKSAHRILKLRQQLKDLADLRTTEGGDEAGDGE